jgi:PAS domain S-box-containing protein
VLCLQFLLAGHGLALDPAKEITQYNCQTWSRQNGLMVNGINAIVQTKDGYLWLGTSAGLWRYNGTEFNLIRRPRPGDTTVTSLASDRNGGLWVGRRDNAVDFFDGEGLPAQGEVPTTKLDWSNHSLLEDKEGYLWIVANHHLARRSPTGVFEELISLSEDQTTNFLCGMADSQGRFWLGTSAQGVFYWQAGQLHKLPTTELDGNVILALAEDHAGNLWIGTTSGLFCYDASLRRKDIPGLDREIYTLLVDRQGVLWIGTSGRGLARYDHGQYDYLGRADGLPSNYILSLTEDREGSLWIGTRNGVSQLTDVKFPTFLPSEDPNTHDAISVFAGRQGGVWVGSSAGLTYLTDQPKTYGRESGLTSLYVKRVLEARNGELYLVSGNDTLAILSKGKVIENFSATNQIVGMAEDDQGVIASIGGDLYRVGKHGFKPYSFTNDNVPPMYWVLNLAAGRNGEIWVACANGIVRVKDGAFQQWTMAQGLSDNRVGSICEDSKGVVWAAMSTGIARLKDNQIRCISQADGLFDNNVFAIVPDDLGNLWVDSGGGVFRVSQQSLNDFADGRTRRVQCSVFDGIDSVKPSDRSFQEQVGCKTLDGRIWFPRANGVVAINPRQIPTNMVSPPVHIQSLRANGRDYPLATNLIVPPGSGELEINYAALSLIAPQKVRFRYQLEGYDKAWVNAESRRLAFYTNLKPGRYTFRVIAANADGVWSQDGDAVSIELRPHYYQTAWFYSLAVGLLLGVLFAGYREYIRRLELKQKKLQDARDWLEAEVSHRTAELAYERDLVRELLENSPDHIYFKDAQSRFIKSSKAQARQFGLTSADQLVGKSDFDFFNEEHARPAFEEEQQIIRTGQPMIGKIEKESWKDGRKESWVLTTKMPLRNKAGEIIGTFGISKDITTIKEAEAKLKEVHQQLIETSRQAGMAEVATNVLHNVGNVLNSVNVSASVVLENSKNSKIPSLAKVVALLDEHAADLGSFIVTDAKGRQVPAYLSQLAGQLAREQEQAIKELELLRQNIEHIKDIVAMQQSYAKISGVTETVRVVDLVEDALGMNAGALTRHEVELIREYTDVPPVTVEKHKVLQILVNLIRNAKNACDESGRKDKKLRLQISRNERKVLITVIDNGIGIPPENLTRIFNHGFTTRKNGHGFGLHSGALAAEELGGALTAHSDGPGQGAAFTLELPLPSVAKT